MRLLWSNLFIMLLLLLIRNNALQNAYMKLSQLDQTNEVMKQGTLLFYQTLYIKESLIVFEENSALAWNQFQQVREMFANGLTSEFAMKQSELYYQQTLPDIENTRKTLGNLRGNFACLPV